MKQIFENPQTRFSHTYESVSKLFVGIVRGKSLDLTGVAVKSRIAVDLTRSMSQFQIQLQHYCWSNESTMASTQLIYNMNSVTATVSHKAKTATNFKLCRPWILFLMVAAPLLEVSIAFVNDNEAEPDDISVQTLLVLIPSMRNFNMLSDS